MSWSLFHSLQFEVPYSFRAIIIIKSHYKGTARLGDSVAIRREPQNAYDRNAIRVEDMRGNQLGHIMREQAALLAPLIDRLKNTELVLEGSVPEQLDNKHWKKTIQIEFYAVNPSNLPPGSTPKIKGIAKKCTDITFPSRFVAPIAKRTGRPCIVCTEQQSFCEYHWHYA